MKQLLTKLKRVSIDSFEVKPIPTTVITLYGNDGSKQVIRTNHDLKDEKRRKMTTSDIFSLSKDMGNDMLRHNFKSSFVQTIN